jgi:secreted Zn-dependent insulinase-like peptidase
MRRRDFVTQTTATATAFLLWNTWRLPNRPVVAAATIPTEDDKDIIIQERWIVPFSTYRQYKTIRLANGMQVVLVSDKVVRQATAALTIQGAGQFADPPGLNGMAHLMEHMTLSSRTSRRQLARNKYQDFEEWLTEVDGSSNGFTGR